MDSLTKTVRKLRSYPYVPLDLDIPLESMRSEYEALITKGYCLQQYQTKYRLVKNYYAKSWSGICLISSDGGLYSDLSEGDIQSDVNRFSKTELSNHCPQTYKVISRLNAGGKQTRSRIMKIAPSRSLLWHSHVFEHGQPENILTVQVPIFVPSSFLYCVMDRKQFRWYKRFASHKRFKNISKVNLRPGKAYIFNSYHYHNVYNLDPHESRVTLMVYIDIANDQIRELIDRSIDKFCGDKAPAVAPVLSA